MRVVQVWSVHVGHNDRRTQQERNGSIRKDVQVHVASLTGYSDKKPSNFSLDQESANQESTGHGQEIVRANTIQHEHLAKQHPTRCVLELVNAIAYVQSFAVCPGEYIGSYSDASEGVST